MALNIKKASEMKIDSNNIGIYGINGSGKTTLASSFLGKVLYIDVNEKGLSSVSTKDLSRINVIEITKFEELIELLDVLKNDKLEELIGFKPDSIVVDTVTQITELFEIWADDNKGRFLSEKGKFDKFKVYKEMNRFAKLFLMGIKSQGTKNAFLFQEKEITDDDGNVIGNGIRATSGVKNIFLSELDIVGRMILHEDKEKKVNYIFDLRAKQNNDIKTRKNKDLDELGFITDPDYSKLQSKLKGSK